LDGYDIADAFIKLKEAGADVVGLNCHNGPDTILKNLRIVRDAVTGPLACRKIF
jgi:methionine synthase I (cobalamin-dependent)